MTKPLKFQKITGMICPFCSRIFYIFDMETTSLLEGNFLIINSCAWCDAIIIEDYKKIMIDKVNDLLAERNKED